jgi:uncharacterized protein (TIGR02246 family)
MQSRAIISSLLVVLSIVSATCTAQPTVGKADEKAPPATNAAKQHRPKILETIATLAKRFNSGDAKGLAELWKPDGYLQGPRGERVFGRENIQAAFEKFFAAHKGSKLQLAVVGGRPVTNDVVVVDAIAEMTPPPEGAEGETRSTIVLVLRDGRWLIDGIWETAGNAEAHSAHLKDLGWMVGDWSGAAAGTPGASMHSTCDWTANGGFLIRKFSVVDRSGSTLNGTEVIGWDPRAHRVRSWIFESDGGFGQSEWTRDGDRWTIRYNGILADGSDVSATQVLTRVDADTLSLQSTDRLLDGRKRPEIAKVTIKRRPAQKGPTPEPAKPPQKILP